MTREELESNYKKKGTTKKTSGGISASSLEENYKKTHTADWIARNQAEVAARKAAEEAQKAQEEAQKAQEEAQKAQEEAQKKAQQVSDLSTESARAEKIATVQKNKIDAANKAAQDAWADNMLSNMKATQIYAINKAATDAANKKANNFYNIDRSGYTSADYDEEIKGIEADKAAKQWVSEENAKESAAKNPQTRNITVSADTSAEDTAISYLKAQKEQDEYDRQIEGIINSLSDDDKKAVEADLNNYIKIGKELANIKNSQSDDVLDNTPYSKLKQNLSGETDRVKELEFEQELIKTRLNSLFGNETPVSGLGAASNQWNSYNYSEDKASQLLDYYGRAITAEQARLAAEDVADYVSEIPVLANAASVLAEVVQIADLPKVISAAIKDIPVDTNAMTVTNFRDNVREETASQYIQSEVLNFLYQTGMSMADFALLLPLNAVGAGEAVTLALMGTNAGISAVKDATERGIDSRSALVTGLAAGIFEALFEKVSIEALLKPQNAKSYISYILKNFISEGSEEVATDMANFVADNLLNGGLSDYNQNIIKYQQDGASYEDAKAQADKDMVSQLWQSFLGGAISGGVMGSLSAAFNPQVKAKINYNKNGLDVENVDGQLAELGMNQNLIDSLNMLGIGNQGKLTVFENAPQDGSITNYLEDFARGYLTGTAENIAEISNNGAKTTVLDGFEAAQKDAETTQMPTESTTTPVETTETETQTVSPESIEAEIAKLENLQAMTNDAAEIDRIETEIQKLEAQSEVLLHGSGEWNDSTSTGESVSALESSTGRETKNGLAYAEQGNQEVSGAETTAKELGLTGGTDETTVQIVSHSEASEAVEYLQSEGYKTENIVLFKGNNLSFNINGERITGVRGCVENGKVFIRTDSKAASALQIAKHEHAHTRIDSGEINIDKAYKAMKDKLGDERLFQAIEAYADAYDGLDPEQCLVEMVCDSEAEMNVFAEGTKEHQVMEGTIGAVKSAVREASTRGPPKLGTVEADKEALNTPIKFSRTMHKQIAENTLAKAQEREDRLSFDLKRILTANNQVEELVKVINERFVGKKDVNGANLLPEETSFSPNIFANSSYLKDAEPTTECYRQTIYKAFYNMVSDLLGRPLTTKEQIIVNQGAFEIGLEAPCIYCYSLLDRKAKEAYKIQYIEERDAFMAELDKEFNGDKEAFHKNRAKVFDKYYQKYLTRELDPSAYVDGKLDASKSKTRGSGNADKQSRVNLWFDLYEKYYGTDKMLTKAQVRNTVAETDTEDFYKTLSDSADRKLSMAALKDLQKWIQAASQAKKVVPYTAYSNEGRSSILNWSPAMVNKLNAEYGLRWYSHAEYHPAFLVDNMQQITDAAVMGLKGLMYTKEMDAAEVFAPTGMNINISCFGQFKNGEYIADDKMGADWVRAKKLREENPNVGIVMVATSDDMVYWALSQDWVDVVIPLHLVRSGSEFIEAFGLQNFSAEQADKLTDKELYSRFIAELAKNSDITTERGIKSLEKSKKSVYPIEHENNYQKYMAAINERGLTARFNRFRQAIDDGIEYDGVKLTGDNYMKLVNETRRSYKDTQPLVPNFDIDAAKRSLETLAEKGYFSYMKPSAPLNGVELTPEEWAKQVARDIEEGKDPRYLGYGRELAVNSKGQYVATSNAARSAGVHGIHMSRDIATKDADAERVQEFFDDVRNAKLWDVTGQEYFDAEVDLYSKYQSGTADENNFFKNTVATFSPVKYRPKSKPDYVSYGRDGKVSSEYWYKEDGVIRGSSHWGLGIRSCDWKLEGFGLRKESVSITSKLYGYCKWEDFLFKTDIVGSKKDADGRYTDFSEARLTSFDNPTGGKDIATKDSDGNTLTEAQEEYFSDDIRYSRDITPAEADKIQPDLVETRRELNRALRKLASQTARAEKWKGQLRISKPQTLTDKSVKEVAEKWASGNHLSADEIAPELKAIGEYGLNQPEGFSIGNFRSKIRDLAVKISENMETKATDSAWEDERKEVLSYIKNAHLNVPAGDKPADFFKRDGIGRQLSGTLHVSFNNAYHQAIDDWWQEMSNIYPEYFPDDVVSTGDQLDQLVYLITEVLTPQYIEMGSASDFEDLVDWVSEDLLSDVLGLTISPDTFADKKLAEKQAAVAEVKEKAAAHEETALAKAAEKAKEHEAKALARVKESADKKITSLKEHYAEVRQNARERKGESETRTRLLKVARRLDKLKTNDVARNYIESLIGDLDLVSKGITSKSLEDLQSLRDWYEDERGNNPDFIRDEGTEKKLKRLHKKRISELNIEDVKELTEVLLNIEHALRTSKSFHNKQVRIETYQAGLQTINGLVPAKHTGSAIRKYGVSLLRPETFILDMIGYDRNAPLYKLTRELAKGANKMYQYKQDAEDMFKPFVTDKKFMKFVNETPIEVTVGRMGEDKITITPGLRMSIYMHAQNSDNLNTMDKGGVIIPEFKNFVKGDYQKAFDNGKKVIITPSQAKAIYSQMTAKEFAFVRTAQDYYENVSKKAINEVSNDMLGYSIAKVDNYYRKPVSRDFLTANFGELKKDGTIQGMGFTKERVHSVKPLMLYDIIKTVNQDIQMHSKYVGLAIPVEDFNRLMSMSVIGYEHSVMEEIRAKRGSESMQYIDDLLAQLQGNGSRTDGLGALIRGLYAGAVLTGNIGVMIKQAASYPTAAAVLGWAATSKGFFKMGPLTEHEMAMMKKHSPMQTYRERGYSTIEMGDIVARKGHTPKVLAGIQKFDIMTTRKLFKASIAYVKANTGLKYDTPAFWQEVGRIHTKVLEETQPSYTTMQRPAILRSDGELIKTFTMFKTQPMQNLNILYEATQEYEAKQRAYKSATEGRKEQAKAERDAARKSVSRAYSAIAVSTLVFAAMQMLVDMIRRNDDKYADEEGNVTLGNVAKGLFLSSLDSLAGMAPYASDAWLLFEEGADYLLELNDGEAFFNPTDYGIEEPVISAINSLIGAGKDMFEILTAAANGWDGYTYAQRETFFRNLYNDLEDIAQFRGIPAANFRKLITSVIKNTVEPVFGEYIGKYISLRVTTDPSKYASDYYDLLFSAWENDKTAYDTIYSEMINLDAFATEKSSAQAHIDSVMKSKIKDAVTDEAAIEKTYSEMLKEVAESKNWEKLDADQQSKVSALIDKWASDTGFEANYEDILAGNAVTDANDTKVAEIIENGNLDAADYFEYIVNRYAYDRPNESGNYGSFDKNEKAKALAESDMTDAERNYIFAVEYPKSKLKYTEYIKSDDYKEWLKNKK